MQYRMQKYFLLVRQLVLWGGTIKIDLAQEFGADHVVNIKSKSNDQVRKEIDYLTGKRY
jgi:hypothetical protein